MIELFDAYQKQRLQDEATQSIKQLQKSETPVDIHTRKWLQTWLSSTETCNLDGLFDDLLFAHINEKLNIFDNLTLTVEDAGSEVLFPIFAALLSICASRIRSVVIRAQFVT